MPSGSTLAEFLAGHDSLAVVCHNNPDPDSLASAMALETIAFDAGVTDVEVFYSGTISHQQNRAFVNLLDIDLSRFDEAAVRGRGPNDLLAFVDHSRPGANNEVPEDVAVDVVFDHHPADDVQARFVDHREDVGATATILTAYVRELDVDVDETLATGLLFAIRRETLGFLRGVTGDEYDAARYLHERVDEDLLHRLSVPSISGATVDAIADAIANRSVRGSLLVSHVGRTSERDALPQAADYLVTLEGVDTAIVFGIVGEDIHLSARTTDARVNVGDVLASAFADVGSAGGHSEMAGGEIPLGIFADYADDGPPLVDIVERVVTHRLYETLNVEEEDR